MLLALLERPPLRLLAGRRVYRLDDEAFTFCSGKRVWKVERLYTNDLASNGCRGDGKKDGKRVMRREIS